MHRLTEIRASLEVGFPEDGLPDAFLRYRGKETRAIGAVAEFPYEDGQFDVVLMAANAVSAGRVKEAHRVLKPEGALRFTVPEKTGSLEGYTMPEVYSLVRGGFNITEVTRPAWWLFGLRGRTITICARKKNWKTLNNTYRPYL